MSDLTPERLRELARRATSGGNAQLMSANLQPFQDGAVATELRAWAKEYHDTAAALRAYADLRESRTKSGDPGQEATTP